MKRAKPKAPKLSEYQLHCSVAAYLDRRFPPGGDVWWTTIGHGGGGKVRGAKLKATGVKRGVPDIMILHRRGNIPSMQVTDPYFIELKAIGKKMTADQLEFARWANGVVQVAYTISDVELILDDVWCLPNPRNVRLA